VSGAEAETREGETGPAEGAVVHGRRELSVS
jgi:hypothetical protein